MNHYLSIYKTVN